MTLVVAFLLALLMIGVVGVLFAGLLGVVRGGGDPVRSNRLMRWRIILQAGAILMFLLLLTMLHNS